MSSLLLFTAIQSAVTMAVGFTLGLLMARRTYRHLVAREVLDWHRRITRATGKGSLALPATLAAMLGRVEHLTLPAAMHARNTTTP